MSPTKNSLDFLFKYTIKASRKKFTTLVQVLIIGKPTPTAIYYLFDMFDLHKFAHFLLQKTRQAFWEQTGEETLLTEGISAEKKANVAA